MNKILYCILPVFIGLTACGTTYELPTLTQVETQQAQNMFAEARENPQRKQLGTSTAERRFNRVSPRISSVGKRYCESLTKDQGNVNCNVNIAIDRKMKQRNAYFTYDKDQPIIRVSLPMLQDTKSDDEVAFVLGHEYGHLIGGHIQKRQKQAVAGAVILGTLTAAATGYSGSYDPLAVQDSIDLGMQLGSRAYSQEYELESDILGTRIASAAGYDPVKGAQFFARPEASRTTNGKLSFWGTHPPDARRLATVIATKKQIDAKVGLQVNTGGYLN